jgi:hypothetical protein
MVSVRHAQPIFTDSEWTFAKLERITEEIERIAQDD